MESSKQSIFGSGLLVAFLVVASVLLVFNNQAVTVETYPDPSVATIRQLEAYDKLKAWDKLYYKRPLNSSLLSGSNQSAYQANFETFDDTGSFVISLYDANNPNYSKWYDGQANLSDSDGVSPAAIIARTQASRIGRRSSQTIGTSCRHLLTDHRTFIITIFHRVDLVNDTTDEFRLGQGSTLAAKLKANLQGLSFSGSDRLVIIEPPDCSGLVP